MPCFGFLDYIICPAYAGMIPIWSGALSSTVYLSRVCGDDPTAACNLPDVKGFVPRMRG